MSIAVEATESEEGFDTILAGAKLALNKNPNLKQKIILVAGKDRLPRSYSLDGIELELAETTYDSSKSKTHQLQSSIYRAMEMVNGKEAEVVIAPGNTRGTVISALRVLKVMPQVLGPAIPTHFPVNNVLIDSGANHESTPENLYQSAIMGKVFAENYLGIESPLIGIITNGKEKNKGNKFIKKSRRLVDKLCERGYNVSEDYFEGDFFYDLNAGKVGVTDGHTGNILLKGVEATVDVIKGIIKNEIVNQGFILRNLARLGLYFPNKNLVKTFSYKQYSTGPLLGVNGNVMVMHGKSDAEAIANAIEITNRYVKCGVNDKLREEIGKYGKV